MNQHPYSHISLMFKSSPKQLWDIYHVIMLSAGSPKAFRGEETKLPQKAKYEKRECEMIALGQRTKDMP